MCRYYKPTQKGVGRNRGGRYGATPKNFPTIKPQLQKEKNIKKGDKN